MVENQAKFLSFPIQFHWKCYKKNHTHFAKTAVYIFYLAASEMIQTK